MAESSWTNTLKIALEAQNALAPSTPQLDHAKSNSKENGLPHIAIGAASGRFLTLLCQLTNAKNILEIGTLGGYSTIWFATSVPGVKVTSIEYDAKHREVALENLEGLDNVEVHHGAAMDVLPKIAETGTVFDFVFIDADWENQANYFEWAVKLTRSGGIVYVDNVLKELIEPDHDSNDVIARAKQNPKVDATLIPVLNTEKATLSDAIDGFVIAKVK